MGTEYGGDFGRGYYLFGSPDTSLTYGSQAVKIDGESSARVIPVYLRALNPLVIRTGEDLAVRVSAGGWGGWFEWTPEERAAYAQGLGYDSVCACRWDQWVVCQPDQIKAATDNDPAVGPGSDLIMADYLDATTRT